MREAVAAFRPLELFRLSLGSVIARGELDGLPLARPEPWGPHAKALAAALDPRRVLGGAP